MLLLLLLVPCSSTVPNLAPSPVSGVPALRIVFTRLLRRSPQPAKFRLHPRPSLPTFRPLSIGSLAFAFLPASCSAATVNGASLGQLLASQRAFPAVGPALTLSSLLRSPFPPFFTG